MLISLVRRKLNDKRILNQNKLNIKQIEKNIIQKKKEEKLNIFSNSHYLDLEKKAFVLCSFQKIIILDT